MKLPTLSLRPAKHDRIRNGHPWIYDNELQLDALAASLPDGSLVDIVDSHKRFVGRGYYNGRSKITVRLLTNDVKEPIDRAFFENRLQHCLHYRKQIGYQGSYRLVFSEGDGLPGLIVDRYEQVLVLQTLTLGMDTRKQMIADILNKQLAPAGIYERNDVPVRQSEGLSEQTGFLSEPFATDLVIEEGGARFLVRVAQGQKTGFYLDQKENHKQLKRFVQGATVLDCFCFTGAFAVYAALHGADRVTAIDSSEEALLTARENARLNNCSDKIEFVHGNVFDFLSASQSSAGQYNVIILDPPPFAKNRSALAAATRGYKEINLRAMKLLRSGGFLFTFSCSHHMDLFSFKKLVAEAARDAGRSVRQLATLHQALDHPMCWHIPETAYLKGFLLHVV